MQESKQVGMNAVSLVKMATSSTGVHVSVHLKIATMLILTNCTTVGAVLRLMLVYGILVFWLQIDIEPFALFNHNVFIIIIIIIIIIISVSL